MTNLKSPRKLPWYLLFCSLLALWSCGGGGGSDDSNETNTFLRVIHAVPDTPGLDIVLDGETVSKTLAYGNVTPYQMIIPGNRNLELRPAGTFFDIFEGTVFVAKETAVTAVAVNSSDAVDILPVADNQQRPLAGNANVRLIGAAPNAPLVDIYITARNADLNTATPLFTRGTFGTATQYTTIASGDYRLRMTITGTKAVLADSGTITIPSRALVSILVLDAVNGGPAQFRLITD